jgi:hypothetical protein
MLAYLVCRECRHVELHAADLDIDVDGTYVVAIEIAPEAALDEGPYR